MKAKDPKQKLLDSMTDKQKAFCKYYIYDWHVTNAAIKAGYSEKTAYSIGSENLKKPEIQAYIKDLQSEGEKLVNLSKQKVADEYIKIAFSSIANLHNTWITRKEFEHLTEEQKACIAEISTQVRRMTINENLYDVEYVKIKLYDKIKALENLSKLYGYNEAEKFEGKIKVSPTTIKWGGQEIKI